MWKKYLCLCMNENHCCAWNQWTINFSFTRRWANFKPHLGLHKAHLFLSKWKGYTLLEMSMYIHTKCIISQKRMFWCWRCIMMLVDLHGNTTKTLTFSSLPQPQQRYTCVGVLQIFVQMVYFPKKLLAYTRSKRDKIVSLISL